jgi:hypothetical protein
MSESKEGNSELLMVHGNNYSGCTVMWQKPGIFLFIRLGEAGKTLYICMLSDFCCYLPYLE